MKTWITLLGGAALSVSACMAPATAPAPSDEPTASESDSVRQMCGGFANLPCPDGKVCVDDPRDACDPSNGGADCSGVCRHAKKPSKQDCADPARSYVETDPGQCQVIRFMCTVGAAYFSDQCGCGCETVTCGPTDCGPALGMANYLCPDGVTVAGPSGQCLANADGTCGWEVISCP